jgi:K+-sensing histidine kinase KdpD
VGGLVTLICYGLGLSLPVTGFCYLIVVVLQSLTGDFRSSAVVSVLCAACLDYFFIPPFFSFRISDSSDTLALITFLVTGLVVTRLVSKTRKAADSEELQRKEMTRLYELALQLLTLEPGTAVGSNLLAPFRSQFDLRAVCLFDAEPAELYVVGNSRDHIAEKTRNAYIEGRNFEDSGSGVAVRLLQAGGRTTGAIGFEGLRNVQLTAGPLARSLHRRRQGRHRNWRRWRPSRWNDRSPFDGRATRLLWLRRRRSGESCSMPWRMSSKLR